MSMFPKPELEPPPREPSWALIAGLLAAGAICVIVILLVSACGKGCEDKELVAISRGTPIYKCKDAE